MTRARAGARPILRRPTKRRLAVDVSLRMVKAGRGWALEFMDAHAMRRRAYPDCDITEALIELGKTLSDGPLKELLSDPAASQVLSSGQRWIWGARR